MNKKVIIGKKKKIVWRKLLFLFLASLFVLSSCSKGSSVYNSWHRVIPALSSDNIIRLYPDDNSILDGREISFLFKSVFRAEDYEIAISENRNFVETYYSCYTDGKSKISLNSFLLTGEGPYYWKVRARKKNDDWGVWSPVSSFTYREMDWENMLPAPDSLITDTTPLLQWEAIEGFEKYELQWAFSKKELIQNKPFLVETNSWELPKEDKLAFGQALYWRIRPYGRNGGNSSWTSIRHFTTAWLDEYASSYGYNKNTILDTTPLLDWEDAEQAVKYEIQYGNSVETMEASQPVVCNDSSYQVPLKKRFYYGESIYWRFRGINEDDVTGPWSGTYSAMFDWVINWSGIQPASGAVLYETNPDLSWNKVDGAEFYQLRYAFDIQELSNAEIHNSDEIVFNFSEPGEYNRTIFWQLRAVNSDGISSRWSRLFRYQNRWDIKWTERSPECNLVTLIPKPDFNWGSVEKAISYRIRLDYRENGTSMKEFFDISDTQWSPDDELPPALYTWYLYAINEKGIESPPSPPMNFEIRDINKTVEALGMSLHMVRVTNKPEQYKGFYLGKYMMAETEISQKDYRIITGALPSHSYGEGDDYPVYYVSWFDAVDFCNILSEVCGLEPVYDIKTWKADFKKSGFRLPTEVEWEYAASGGKNLSWPLGNDFNDDDYIFNRNTLLPVPQHSANPFGLYNLGGSVQEWCHDWWQDDFSPDAKYEENTGYRSVRGGSWKNRIPDLLMNDMRNLNFPSNTSAEIGFRPVIQF